MKPLFDQIERQIILDYYQNPPKNKWWNAPLFVTQFEAAKAKRDFGKAILKPIVEFLNRKLWQV